MDIRSVVLTATLLTMSAVLAACGDSPADPGRSGPAADRAGADPCSLLSAAEVEDLLGEAQIPSRRSSGVTCVADGRSGRLSVRMTAVGDVDTARRLYEQDVAFAGWPPSVPNVGDAAFRILGADEVGITALAHDMVLKVSLIAPSGRFGPGREVLLARLTPVVRAAASRRQPSSAR